MGLVTTATAKIFKVSAPSVEIDSSATSPNYILDDLVAGDYVYKITANTKGTIIDFISIPEDFGESTSFEISRDMYDACDSTVITVNDNAAAGIAGLNVQVDNIEITDGENGTYTSTVLPQNPDGCMIKINSTPIFSALGYDDTYETFIDKVVFPLALDAITIVLSEAFFISLTFKDGATNLNQYVNSIQFRYVYTNLDKSDIITIQKESNTIKIPENLAHSGKIEIVSVAMTGDTIVFVINEDEGTQDIVGNDTGGVTVNIECTLIGEELF